MKCSLVPTSNLIWYCSTCNIQSMYLHSFYLLCTYLLICTSKYPVHISIACVIWTLLFNSITVGSVQIKYPSRILLSCYQLVVSDITRMHWTRKKETGCLQKILIIQYPLSEKQRKYISRNTTPCICNKKRKK